MGALSRWAYVACVNFMLNAAAALGLTYRDMNVIVLLLAFPALTLAAFALAVAPRRPPPR